MVGPWCQRPFAEGLQGLEAADVLERFGPPVQCQQVGFAKRLRLQLENHLGTDLAVAGKRQGHRALGLVVGEACCGIEDPIEVGHGGWTGNGRIGSYQ